MVETTQTAQVMAWGTILGIVLPYLIAVVQQPTWTGTTRRIVAIVVSVLVGVVTAYVNGNLTNVAPTATSVLAAVAAVFVASQAVYARFAAPTAKTIEVATSPSPPTRATRRNT